MIRLVKKWGLDAAVTAAGFVYRRIRPAFVLNGRTYPYFWHLYNRTIMSERCVEIPVVWDHVLAGQSGRVLEIGNVLSHYFPCRHDVVDKYEVAPGVHNVDVVDWRPLSPYDLIVSISTLEHVGWDESPRDPRKILRALRHLQGTCLAEGGTLVMTFPFGYNPLLDEICRRREIPFTDVYCMKRTSLFNGWGECTMRDLNQASFGHPFPYGNGLFIGVFKKKPG